jgi:uncharacterized protein DUF5985
MVQLLLGAIAATAFVIGLFFLRFWRATRDRFFLLFALAFWIEGAHRVVAYHWEGSDEGAPLYFLLRLVAYGLIIAAIIDKNRSGK